jgi:uncharacterized protein (DUF1015 family)
MIIKPFAAYRFNSTVTGDSGSCIAPPYDVIDEHQQDELYRRNPYNVVRAIRGKKMADDDAGNNVYTRAGAYLDKAIAEGALKQDSEPSIYAYVQDFSIASQAYERSGVIALGKIEPFGKGVRAHEKTLEGPKADRLNLSRATAAQFGQIFMLYDDPENADRAIFEAARKTTPVLDFTDPENVRHRVWRISEEAVIERFAAAMLDKQTIIADGHHRYETALNYWAETGRDEAQYLMMTFINTRNPGLVIQPTHRMIVNMPEFDAETLLATLDGEFEVTTFAFDTAEGKQGARKAMFEQMVSQGEAGRNIFGFYAGGKAFYTILLKSAEAMTQAAGNLSYAARELDVNVLHMLILDKHLGISDAKLASQSHIDYIKDLGDAIDKSIGRIDVGKAEAVFFVNPTRIEQVQDIAAVGEKMPQKSTFFYPKLFSGVTINKLPIEPIQPKLSKPNFQECTR